MEKAAITMLMETSTLDSGLRTKRTGMEFFNMHQVLCMMASGLMTKHQTEARSSTPTKTSMRVTS